jgi:hypothetical protein
VLTEERQYFLDADNDMVKKCVVKLSPEVICINLIILSFVLKHKEFECVKIIITLD